MTPSPIRSSPIDLTLFPLVDIEATPMDQHEQDPLGHVLGGAHNGQHGVDRREEDHERASNVMEVEAQMRIMRGLHERYMANTYLNNSTSYTSHYSKS